MLLPPLVLLLFRYLQEYILHMVLLLGFSSFGTAAVLGKSVLPTKTLRQHPDLGRESCTHVSVKSRSCPRQASRSKTTWPSGLRRTVQVRVRKGVGSNPTVVSNHASKPWCSWLSHSPNTRKVSSSILDGFIGDPFYLRFSSLIADFCCAAPD